MVCDRFGGPEVLELRDVAEPTGELLVEVSAAGVTFADTSRIAGSYRPVPALAGFWLRPARSAPGTCAEPLAEMFTLVTAGTLRPQVHAAYPLVDARRAVEDLIARRTTGKITLRP